MRSTAQKIISTFRISDEQPVELEQQMTIDNRWISVKDNPPPYVSDTLRDKVVEVLVITDYTKWGRGKHVRIASVWFADEPRPYGGPHALTGSGMLTGIYFSIPAVLHPDVVTHWQPLPSEDVEEGVFSGLFATDGTPAKTGDTIRFVTTEGSVRKHTLWYNKNLQCLMVGSVPYFKLYESGYIQPSKLQFEIIKP